MAEGALQIAATGAFWTIALALVFSCLTDLRYRIVCDEVSLVVCVASLVLFVSRDLTSSHEWLAYAAIIVAVLGAAMAGVMGGGDAKLVFALLPGMTAAGCLQFVVVTSVAGGVLGLCVLALSRLLRSHRKPRPAGSQRRHPLAQWFRHETARLRRGRSIPYVPAIAVGWFAAVQAL